MAERSRKIVIIGAGIAGLCTAISHENVVMKSRSLNNTIYPEALRQAGKEAGTRWKPACIGYSARSPAPCFIRNGRKSSTSTS